MIYFNVLGQPFLILGSFERTSDLMEKRSLNYSDRLRMPMLELYVSDSLNLVKKFQLVSEWGGISTSVFCPTASCGEDTGKHFISISTKAWCPNICQFKDERSMLFYVDCLTHPTISSAMFDSTYCSSSVTFQGDNKMIRN
jgi:hypothetical protein